MDIKFICTHWGQEHLGMQDFLDKVVASGYGGVEIYLPERGARTGEFMDALEIITDVHPTFKFIAQQIVSAAGDSAAGYIGRMKRHLYDLASLQPTFINAHTGTDFFSFDDNCRAIEAALEVSAKTGIPIFHETHRGRFSFHASLLLSFLDVFPELELVGDFSHFCTVSESLLYDQTDVLERIIPHVSHLHARVGHEQSPQVNDPFAPEWQAHLQRFESWWIQVLRSKASAGASSFTITPEHGPFPYMPQMPFTRLPLSDQWEVNRSLMERINFINPL